VVLTVKVAELRPDVTVTDAGSVAALLLLVSATTVPPEPAGPLNVTVPVEAFPPSTDEGFKLRETSVAGVIVKLATALVAPKFAVIAAVVLALTPVVFTVNVALV
jgi:hypothetical protein